LKQSKLIFLDNATIKVTYQQGESCDTASVARSVS